MQNHEQCEGVRRDLAALRYGWLKPDRAALVEAHLAACSDCAAEARRDARLVSELEFAEAAVTVVPPWAQVLETRGRAATHRNTMRRPLLGLSGALAAAALLVVYWTQSVGGVRGPQPGDTAGPFGAADSVRPAAESQQVLAHNMISAGSLSGDPNRDVVLMFGTAAGGTVSK